MDISNKITYYMKVMPAYIVNKNSSDDPSGDSKRAQVYIPSIQMELKNMYKTYINESDKKNAKGYRKFPWAYNTVENLNEGDLVYVSALNNTNGDYLIIGRDASCFPSGGIGGGDSLDASGIAELLAPLVIHNEMSQGTMPTLSDAWDNNISDYAYGNYNTNTSKYWTVGIGQWDATRAYNLLLDIAREDGNWRNNWGDKSSDLYKALDSDCNGGNYSSKFDLNIIGRTSNQSTISSIKSMLVSSVGKKVQLTKLRADLTNVVQGLMDSGIINPAIIIMVGDIVHQYGSIGSELKNAAKNPSSLNVNQENLNKVISSYSSSPSSMMQDFEKFQVWFFDTYLPTSFHNQYKPRRSNAPVYIRELYKQGKLVDAGLTMIGDLVATSYRGITIVSPLKDEVVAAYQSDFFSGTLHHQYKAHKINTYFGSYKTMYQNGSLKPHAGVDFNISRGELYYASHNGTMTVTDSNRGYGYHVKIKFNEAGHNWTIIYGHMDRALSKPYFTPGTYEIKAGQPVGAGDSTGNSTGDHLHYEIQMDGTPINPLLFLGMGNAVTKFYPNRQLNE